MFAKRLNLDIPQGSKYASYKISKKDKPEKYVTNHHKTFKFSQKNRLK